MLTYTHTQNTSSAIWTVPHNMNLNSVMVDVIVVISGTNTSILPSKIVKTSANQLSIVFSTAYIGTAIIRGSTGSFVDYAGFVPTVERTIDYTNSPLA